LDRGAGRFPFDLIDGSERWGGAGAAALAAPLSAAQNDGIYVGILLLHTDPTH